MGVLTDYFRAPSRAAVVAALGDDRGSPVGGESGFDGLELKGIDPDVLLGVLVAAILEVEWTPDLTGSTMVYPPEETKPVDPEAFSELSDDSPWTTGPWITELNAETRNALASLDLAQVPSLAATWADAEEFGGYMPVDAAAETIVAFKVLAARAMDANELLYCWACL